jgi:hypothetical protein
MPGPEFFQTGMGKRFFEHTAPALVEAVSELVSEFKAMHSLLESQLSRPQQPVDTSAVSNEVAATSAEAAIPTDTVYTGHRRELNGQRVRICGIYHCDTAGDWHDAYVELKALNKVSAGDHAYIVLFSANGRPNQLLQTEVTNLECFAHLSLSEKAP